MRRVWLAVIIASLAGVILYLVAEFAYPRTFYLVGANVEKQNFVGLPGWVRFYREYNFVVVSLVTLVIGVGGFLISTPEQTRFGGAIRRRLRMLREWRMWLRPVAMNGFKLLLIVVVSGTVGYYAGHWDTEDKTQRRYPVFRPSNSYDDSYLRRELDSLRQELGRMPSEWEMRRIAREELRTWP